MLEAILDSDGAIRLPAEVGNLLGVHDGGRIQVSVAGAGNSPATLEVRLHPSGTAPNIDRPLRVMTLEQARAVLDNRSAWAEREDIGDGLTFVRELRAGDDARQERLDRIWDGDDVP